MPLSAVDRSLTPSPDRTRPPHQSVSAYRAVEGMQRALWCRPAAPLQPADFASALYRRLQQVERRGAWIAFRRVLVRCASVLVLEGD